MVNCKAVQWMYRRTLPFEVNLPLLYMVTRKQIAVFAERAVSAYIAKAYSRRGAAIISILKQHLELLGDEGEKIFRRVKRSFDRRLRERKAVQVQLL